VICAEGTLSCPGRKVAQSVLTHAAGRSAIDETGTGQKAGRQLMIIVEIIDPPGPQMVDGKAGDRRAP